MQTETTNASHFDSPEKNAYWGGFNEGTASIQEQLINLEKEVHRLKCLALANTYKIWKGTETSLSYSEFMKQFNEENNL